MSLTIRVNSIVKVEVKLVTGTSHDKKHTSYNTGMIWTNALAHLASAATVSY